MPFRLSDHELHDYERAVRRSNRTASAIVTAVIVLALAAVLGLTWLLLCSPLG